MHVLNEFMSKLGSYSFARLFKGQVVHTEMFTLNHDAKREEKTEMIFQDIFSTKNNFSQVKCSYCAATLQNEVFTTLLF